MSAQAVTGQQQADRQLHKFGGSSLADVKCYLRVAGIMAEYSRPGDMMVVSAAGSTTNQLISWLKLSQSDRISAHQVQQALRRYQSELIVGLLPPEMAEPLQTHFIRDLERLAALLDGEMDEAAYAEVVGHGEVWSARLMAAVLQSQGLEATWLDARDFLCAEHAAQPQVDERRSYPLLQQLLAQHPNKRLVVTGFISRSGAGETVLLGRNGSDYSATQIGALAGVRRVTIWSDVAGVYSADPRKVKMPVYCRCCVWMRPASWLAWLHRCCMPARCSRCPPAISICSCAAAISRSRGQPALSGCWPAVTAPRLSPAMTMSA